jgi:hypothetical protein
MEEKDIPLKEFSSKFLDKEEDEDKSDLEDGDLEKVLATDFSQEGKECKEGEETASRDWREMLSENVGVEENQADGDSLKEVVTIPSKSGGKENEKVKWGQQTTTVKEELKKLKVGNIVKDSFGELKKKKIPTQECDMTSDSSDVSLEEVYIIPNFKVEEKKCATADEESENEEKAKESVEGYSRGNKRKDLKSKAPSHEFDMSDSFEVSLNEPRTIPPCFINDEKGTEEIDREFFASKEKVEDMTERIQPTKQESESSSDSSEVSLEEIPSNFIDDDEEEESLTDAFHNKNLETIEEVEESDEENVIRFPPEEEINAMDEIPLDDTEAEGEEPLNEDREPKLSFTVGVRLIVAVGRLRQKCKVNSVLSAVQPLEVALNLGYYFFVVPFKIFVDKDGKFKIHVNPWQMVCLL